MLYGITTAATDTTRGVGSLAPKPGEPTLRRLASDLRGVARCLRSFRQLAFYQTGSLHFGLRGREGAESLALHTPICKRVLMSVMP